MAGKASTDPNVFILPDLGEGVHEAELISWKVEPGQTVEEHEIIAEMETDKALVEVPSPRAGTIKTLHGEPGETLLVGKPLVTYEGGEGSSAAADASPGATADASEGEETPGSEDSAGGAEQEDAGSVVGIMDEGTPGMNRSEGRALAAPAVRRLARDLGVEIDLVPGTGIGGRVTAKDVRAYAESGGATAAAGGGASGGGGRALRNGRSAPPPPQTRAGRGHRVLHRLRPGPRLLRLSPRQPRVRPLRRLPIPIRPPTPILAGTNRVRRPGSRATRWVPGGLTRVVLGRRAEGHIPRRPPYPTPGCR